MAQVPGGAATASLLLLAALLWPAQLTAQQAHQSSPQFAPLSARTPLEREVGKAVVCMCGTCGRKLVGDCDCSMAAAMRDEIAMLARQGKTKPQILNHFVEKYGSQEPLAEPINEGFNRLAWLLPYVVGGGTLLGVLATARRWTRSTPATAGGGAAIDPELSARLDDELRDLD
jgi:cytochrome c-type biogenesis protein CcmH/NrfF